METKIQKAPSSLVFEDSSQGGALMHGRCFGMEGVVVNPDVRKTEMMKVTNPTPC